MFLFVRKSLWPVGMNDKFVKFINKSAYNFFKVCCHVPQSLLNSTINIHIQYNNCEFSTEYIIKTWPLTITMRLTISSNQPTIREREKNRLSSPNLHVMPKALLLLSISCYRKRLIFIALALDLLWILHLWFLPSSNSITFFQLELSNFNLIHSPILLVGTF